MNIIKGTRGMKVLDFDVECRPLAWYGGDFVTKQPTAIAWKVVGDRAKPSVAYIGESGISANVLDEEEAMLTEFIRAYDDADIVTGHFIRGFDLPLLNGALIRLGMSLLEDKLTQDTKNDFAKRHGMSLSQENLGATFELHHPKVPMNTARWEAGNMLLPHGIEWTKERVVGDVKQHIELRQKMLDQGLLRRPQYWSSKAQGGSGRYHA